MKSAPAVTFYDLPLSELRARAGRAVEALRGVRARAAGRPAVCGDAASCLGPIDEAVAAVERLLPGFMDVPSAVLSRTLADLDPNDRRAIRRAIDAERAARERLVQWIGEVPASQVEDALARIEVRELVAAELSAWWEAAQTEPASPQC